MKILSVHLENFASYETLDFSFDANGLALIHGATGSGKSTLMDAIPWVLFGITAKGGKADEVLSWHGGATYGTLSVEVNGTTIQITRTRKPNDLYFRAETNTDANHTRGKDLQDTQKRINELLGMDADLYLAGAYFHEFSQTAQFFTTTAKNRREITEQLVDLSLPISLQNKIRAQNKRISMELAQANTIIATTLAKIQALSQVLKDTQDKNERWAVEISGNIANLEHKAESFEITKRGKIKQLETEMNKHLTALTRFEGRELPKTITCKSCGKTSENLDKVKVDAMKSALISAHEQLKQVSAQENTYQTQIIDLKNQANPHTSGLLKLDKDMAILNDKLAIENKSNFDLQDQQLNLDLLSGIMDSFRAELVRNTIEDLETQTNQHLYNHFDGEIKVGFTITDTDKLDVTLTKDGNEASYTQLSKGQRQMLKLSFGVAVMQTIAKHHSISFDQVFLDEALDGLDDSNKMKAVKMLHTLSLDYGSVFIVEHSETVKAMVDKKYYVQSVDGRSQIEKQ
jgi:DNA repair exonuclease SbcCD ATPase subunit